MDNQIYGLTKGQLSPTSKRGLHTVTSTMGSLERPFNPLLAVLAYGAPFVAQGTPADMGGLAAMIEEAIRYPGFAFVNVQSPCVTFGDPDWQLKAHKAALQKAADRNHDPSNRLAALDLAQGYGRELVTGVLYRDPEPPPTYESLVKERQEAARVDPRRRADVLEGFTAHQAEAVS
jgi:2-oxoglutarate ferredoxin oxidoreductase subunit beta